MTKFIIKLSVVLFLFVMLISCSQQNKMNKNNKTINHNLTEENIYIGMDIKDFKKICPQIVGEEHKPTQSFIKSDVIAGMEGSWFFNFSDSKLTWFSWNVYDDDINQKNFEKCLKATREIIKIYKKKYGEPTDFTEGKLKYIDPYKKRHWGYDVLRAYWKTDKIKFANEFKFMGGKGNYNFLIKIEFHSADYKYF